MLVPGQSKVSVITLGCPKNLVDSEYLLGQLQKSTLQLTERLDDADTVVINTCGFIQDAKQESIDAIMEAVEKKKCGQLKKIVVMGCLSERFKKELAGEIPEVDSFFGTNQLSEVLTDLHVNFKKELIGERYLTTPSHYAYLKISEGCDNPCSFCAIPLMRGRHRSRSVEEILNEARTLAERGVRELIVIAQDSTYYGWDLYGERRLAVLLEALQKIDGIEWIRLMYAYPAKFPSDVITAFQKYPKLCRYIDIPIQHIADNVLKSMQRGISQRPTRELLVRLMNEIPGLAIRTTLIVGYPNETEDDFNELCDFIEEMRFHRLGVFPYSQEEGTGAFNLGDPIPIEVKQERQAMIMEIQKEISEQHNETLIGTTAKVLIDSKNGEYDIGRTEWDAPEIDQEVFVRTTQSLKRGSFHTVTITDAMEYDLFASM
jgi:ribosomal protein S12 methylthiotransferase